MDGRLITEDATQAQSRAALTTRRRFYCNKLTNRSMLFSSKEEEGMLRLGLDEDKGFVYEGSASFHGHGIWPSPVITPAKIVFTSEGPLKAQSPNQCASSAVFFREDSFDPIARIRRGRFYSGEGIKTQPTSWIVQPHPAMPLQIHLVPDMRGMRKDLKTFASLPISRKYLVNDKGQPLVVLGQDDRFTIWTIVDIEVIHTGEELVTLKARNSLGVLPTVDYNRIPVSFRASVRERLDAFADEVHRSAPVSVIDRARDAASQVLLAYFEARGKAARDLNDMALKLKDEQKFLAMNAALVIAKLHSRAKPSETARREQRTVREQDAQVAAQCVGVVLCELGWADWT